MCVSRENDVSDENKFRVKRHSIMMIIIVIVTAAANMSLATK